MLTQMVALFPETSGVLPVLYCICGGVLGLVLWLSGVRYSRAFITFLGCAIGLLLGYLVICWTGWHVTPWIGAIVMMFLVGAFALAAHDLWLAMSLAGIFSFWALLVAWATLHSTPWAWPATEGHTFIQYISLCWSQLEPGVQKAIRFACGFTALGGLALGLVATRLSIVLFYSLVGVSLLVIGGLGAVRYTSNSWLNWLLAGNTIQFLILIVLVVMGFIVQWYTSTGPSSAKKNRKDASDKDK